MTMRGLGVIVLLALLGTAAGAAAAYLTTPEPELLGSPAPVPAQSPSIPVDPPPDVLPDPDFATLAPDVPTHPETIGTGDFAVTYPVPNGWDRFEIALAERRYTLPDNPPNTFHLRVESVSSQRLTIQQQLDRREIELGPLTALSFVERTEDRLVFTFVDGTSHLRFAIVRWVEPADSGVAELEVAATGRIADEEGLRSLVQRVGDGARVP